ncbi:uncharacterized protein LOC122028934 [Zingiber officinale]|uniref:uncharacterized protein LOC122028934 n=1 Tax=Zingiber officinale TaxID=94328 RepID=UPI001C4B928E|nr:uncharacterized protein LOC122028934 [Zingiber officinale]
MIIYLQQGVLPIDPEEARLIRKRAHVYTLIEDQLYKRAFSRSLLKCLGTEEAKYALQEVYQGCCGNHVGGRMLARKVLLVGYFWPTLQKDAQQQLVSDNGRQFQRRKIQEWCRGFGITQAFTFVAYPQSNGQTKVTNREIVQGLKVKLDHIGGDWVEELASILWAYHTTPRESTVSPPFHLVYGSEAVVPIEVGVPSIRRLLYDEENAERRFSKLDFISETRE